MRSSISPEGFMYKLLCFGCAVAIIIGTIFRFLMLSQGLAEAKLLPKSWRRWLYDVNHSKKTS
jgi:hypothetical protein